MSDPMFPILGTTIPPMLGRSSIMQRIWNDLTKTTPSNLSIVGPRFVGKTVIMNALAYRVAHKESPYAFVLHWHLGHISPVSDDDFITRLCDQLQQSLYQSKADTSEYRKYLEDHSFSNLSEVVDILDEEGSPILMLWDGFDKPLGQGKLTGHLWDQMRTLFYGWQDCPAGAKDLYIHLIDGGDLLFTKAERYEAACLIEKCFAKKTGNKLAASCRMLQEHIQGAKPNTGSMARLFGSWDDYRANIRSLLERRLAHISRFDSRLYRLIERAIDDIPDYLDDCLSNLTGIRDCALKLIWQREFGAGMCVPQDIVSYWTEYPRNGHKLIDSMMRSNCWDVPTNPLDQIRLLGLLTGSYQNFDIKAKATSKDIYVLIDAIHNFRNRSQHPDGQLIHLGVAVTAIMACLELLACLEREQLS